MRKVVIGLMLLTFTLPALAWVEGDQVAYLSGTTTTVKAGSIGTLKTTDAEALVFASSEATLRLPYAKMDHIGYHPDVTRHLGVLPAMAAGLVRKRERRHFLDIIYRDDSDKIQVAQFDLAKGVPATLLPVLRARAPKACSAKYPDTGCSVPKISSP